MVGLPEVVTVKVPALPWVKVVLFTEVMLAGVSTVRAKVVSGWPWCRCRSP